MPGKIRVAFYSRQWFRYVAAVCATVLAMFSLGLGPLFLFRILQDANGQPAVDAGIALSVMSVPLSLVAALNWFNVIARRRPILRLCREAIEIYVVGASSLDGTPLIPSLVRIVWLIVSLQGFRSQIGWIPWSMLKKVNVVGAPLMRTLVIEGTILYPSFVGNQVNAKIGDSIAFDEAEFAVPLADIARAIVTCQQDKSLRDAGPSVVD